VSANVYVTICLICYEKCHAIASSKYLFCVISDSLSSSGNQVIPPAAVEEEEELEDEQLADLTTIVSEEVIQEADIAPPPQTDISP